MDTIVKKLDELKEAIKSSTEDKLLTRKEVEEKYNLSKRAVANLFNSKGFPVIDVGQQEQRVSQRKLEEIFSQGIKL